MAHGYECVHCGRQETPHTYQDQDMEGPDTILAGYKYSLTSCPGFTYPGGVCKKIEKLGLDPDLGKKRQLISHEPLGTDSY